MSRREYHCRCLVTPLLEVVTPYYCHGPSYCLSDMGVLDHHEHSRFPLSNMMSPTNPSGNPVEFNSLLVLSSEHYVLSLSESITFLFLYFNRCFSSTSIVYCIRHKLDTQLQFLNVFTMCNDFLVRLRSSLYYRHILQGRGPSR